MSKNKRQTKFDELVVDLIRNSPENTLSREQIISVLRLNSDKEIKQLDKCLSRLANSNVISRKDHYIMLADKKKGQIKIIGHI
jgi:ribonuclease R